MFDVIISQLDPISTDSDLLFQIFKEVNELLSRKQRANFLLSRSISTSCFPTASSHCSIASVPSHPSAWPNGCVNRRQLETYLGPDRLGKLLFSARPSFYHIQYYQINLALIRVLLEAGADPNTVADHQMHRENNTRLHFVAAVSNRELGDAAGLLLVEFGAKPHLVNRCGNSAIDIWIEKNQTEEAGGWTRHARPEWTLPPVPTLLHQSVRVIQTNKIP